MRFKFSSLQGWGPHVYTVDIHLRVSRDEQGPQPRDHGSASPQHCQFFQASLQPRQLLNTVALISNSQGPMRMLHRVTIVITLLSG